MMPKTFKQRLKSFGCLALAAFCALGSAGCIMFLPTDSHAIYVDGNYRDSVSIASHVGVDAMIDRWFIKRTAVVDGQTVTYYVDRSDSGKIYTMVPRKSCYGSRCEENLYFTPAGEALAQQLLAIEAGQTAAAKSPPPEQPNLLPDPRITVPTLPPTPLPRE